MRYITFGVWTLVNLAITIAVFLILFFEVKRDALKFKNVKPQRDDLKAEKEQIDNRIKRIQKENQLEYASNNPLDFFTSFFK